MSDILEMRAALENAQADGKLAAELGQALLQHKKEIVERLQHEANREAQDMRDEIKSLQQEISLLREEKTVHNVQMKEVREQSFVFQERAQELEQKNEELGSEIERLRLKTQSLELSNKKLTEEQDQLVADIEKAEDELLRLRRVELSLRQERDRIQDKLDEVKMSSGRHEGEVASLIEEVEKLRPLQHQLKLKEEECLQLQDALKEEQARADEAMASWGVEKSHLTQTIEDLRGHVTELKAKAVASKAGAYEKALNRAASSNHHSTTLMNGNGYMNGNSSSVNVSNTGVLLTGDVMCGTKESWPLANGKLPVNGMNVNRGLGVEQHYNGHQNHLHSSHITSQSAEISEHNEDNCPCGAEHIKHVLAHSKRPHLKVCESCQKHFCRRCSAYQIYGRDYRQIDARGVLECYSCWLAKGGTLADAAAALSKAFDETSRRSDAGRSDGVWIGDDSNMSVYSDAGSEAGFSKSSSHLLAKVKGFMTLGMSQRR